MKTSEMLLETKQAQDAYANDPLYRRTVDAVRWCEMHGTVDPVTMLRDAHLAAVTYIQRLVNREVERAKYTISPSWRPWTTAIADRKAYLGDGVYAEDDGFGIWLTTMRETGEHRIYLEPEVLAALNEYAAVKRGARLLRQEDSGP